MFCVFVIFISNVCQWFWNTSKLKSICCMEPIHTEAYQGLPPTVTLTTILLLPCSKQAVIVWLPSFNSSYLPVVSQGKILEKFTVCSNSSSAWTSVLTSIGLSLSRLKTLCVFVTQSLTFFNWSTFLFLEYICGSNFTIEDRPFLAIMDAYLFTSIVSVRWNPTMLNISAIMGSLTRLSIVLWFIAARVSGSHLSRWSTPNNL